MIERNHNFRQEYRDRLKREKEEKELIEMKRKPIYLKIFLLITKYYHGKDWKKAKENILGSSRKREFKETRQIIHFFLKRYSCFTLKRIGTLVGNRDHSTVINSISRVEALYDSEYLFAKDIDLLDNEIRVLIELHNV